MSMLSTPSTRNTAGTEKSPLKTRSRRGCLTCRSRRLKCDESTPSCENCVNDERTCKWGLKASFHASRMHSLSKAESEFILSLESRQRRPTDLKFVDNTEEIASEYLTYGHGLEDSASSEVATETSRFHSEQLDQGTHSGTTRADLNASHSRSNEQQNLYPRAFLDVESSTASGDQTERMAGLASEQDLDDGGHFSPQDEALCPTDHSTTETSPASFGAGRFVQNDNMPPWPITQYSKARLISAYLKETAKWCETTDTDRHFSLKSAHVILSSQALSAAVAAVASRQLDNMGGKARVETLELYDFARKTLCSLQAWENDEIVLASVVHLCVYCMMSMEVVEWRLHLRGCAGTFQEMGWSGSSGGLPSACFWAFARIDIWAAYLTRQTTLIPTDFWIRPDYVEADPGHLQDKYANKAIWIFARIINQLFKNGDARRNGLPLPSEPTSHEFAELWKEMDAWFENRPPCIQAVVEVEPSKTDAFPFILFGNAPAICGNIFYHTGCLLLLGTTVQRMNLQEKTQFDPSWHARRIGGISTTTDDHSNWVNNLQPVFIAARFCNEPAEKIAILKHLKDIEVATGWKTSSRSTELREMWGLG